MVLHVVFMTYPKKMQAKMCCEIYFKQIWVLPSWSGSEPQSLDWIKVFPKFKSF